MTSSATVYSYDRTVEARSGWFSWKQVNELAYKFNGALDRGYRSKSDAAQDTRWTFKSKGDWNVFVDSLKKNHMNFKADPRSMNAVVWF
jgi:hypothetical protein